MLACEIYSFAESFKEGFDDMVWFVAVKQLQMEVAAGFVGKALEKLTRKPEPEGGGVILSLLFFR